jgi:hypothetical protein
MTTAERFLIGGFVFSYAVVRDWEAKLTSALPKISGEDEKAKSAAAGTSTRHTSLVHGRWKYLLSEAPQSGRGQGLLPIGRSGQWRYAGPSYDRRPRRVSPGNLNRAQKGRPASDEQLPWQPP